MTLLSRVFAVDEAPWGLTTPSLFPSMWPRADALPAESVWKHLRGVFGDRGATGAELADSMLAAGFVCGEPHEVAGRLEDLLATLAGDRSASRRVVRDGDRFRALPA